MSPQPHPDLSNRQIIKNLCVISCGFLFLYVSYDALFMLQSTMNRKEGIGVACQAIVYCCFCLSSLLLPKYIIKKLGSKTTLTIGMFFCVPYVASNFYPHWAIMVPCAMLAGLGSSLLWASQCTYLNEISILYARHKSEECPNGRPVTNIVNESSVSCEKYTVSNKGSTTDLKTCSTWTSQICADKNDETLQNSQNTLSYADKNDEAQKNPPNTQSCSSKNGEAEQYVKNTQSFADKNDETLQNCADKDDEARQNPQNNQSCANKNGEAEKCVKNTQSFADKNDEALQNSQNLEKYNAFSSSDFKLIESTTARFFGFHGMAYMATRIISNLMSFYLLQKDAHTSQTNNSTCICGANFCNEESECFAHNVETPSNQIRYTLTGICVVIGLFSVLLVGIFLDPLKKDSNVTFSLQFMMSTFKQAKKKKQILLTPLSFYVGMIQGFYTGDFTKSYIACAWGTYHVGLVSICYGATCAAASLISGWLIKIVGRLPIFIVASMVNLGSILIFLMWHPQPQKPSMFFIASGMWGISTGIFWSQLRAFIGILFKKDEEAAFGAYYLWYSLGWCLSFAYSNYFCTYVKVYVLLAVSSTGILGYLMVELPFILNKNK